MWPDCGHCTFVSWDTLVSKVIGYGLDVPDLIPTAVEIFPFT
jgi:hypothetical protein